MENVNKRAVGALVLAELISTLGSRMTYLALPWFVLVTTGSAAKMSVVLAVQILPMAILGVPSGTLVQRLGSRTAMLASRLRARAADHGAAAAVLGRPAVVRRAARDRRGDRGVHAAVRGLATRDPPELVGEDVTTMSQANSLIEGGTAAAALIGPALAGILIPFVGAPNVLYIDAATYLVAFILVLAVRPAPEAARDQEADRRAVRGRALRRPRRVHGLARARHRRLRLLQLGAVGGVAGARVSRSSTARGSQGSSTARSAPER